MAVEGGCPRGLSPRVRGNLCLTDDRSTSGNNGLSPRVRGNRVATHHKPPLIGSIPARTGEPAWRRRSLQAGRVYPRAYGGTLMVAFAPMVRLGLSPRVRGNPNHQIAIRDCRRSIPGAYGGTQGGLDGLPVDSGLSPRVRGNHCAMRCPSITKGLSPRVRGNLPLGVLHHILCGLSPRVRGNRRGSGVESSRSGSLPARTGEPSAGLPHAHTGEVYPRAYGGTGLLRRFGWSVYGLSRAYGGTDPAPPVNSASTGLSPRVRGNPRELG